MSETSNDKTLKLLAESKQKSQQIEASFKQSINESVTNASVDWSNALQSIVNEIDHLSKTLVNNSLTLSQQQIQTAQSELDDLMLKLNALSQNLSNMITSVSEKVTSSETSVTDSLEDLTQAVSEQSTQAVNQSKTILAAIPQQVETLSQQMLTDTQKAVAQHQHRVRQMNKLGMRATLFTLFEILVAAALFGFNYYLSNQVYQTQQRLDTLQAHISQTPLETQALSMVSLYTNQGKEGGVLITPKNQQTAFWGNNQQGEKTLLVTELVSAKNTTPPKKDNPTK